MLCGNPMEYRLVWFRPALVLGLLLGLALPALAAPRTGGRSARSRNQRPLRVDGVAFCEAAITRIARRTARGQRTRVVFDIDNTLVDTRWRTRAAARSFGKQRSRGRARLQRIALGGVGYDGQQTAAGLGYGKATAGRFQAHWRNFFWNAKNFKHDRAIRQTVEIAHRAKAAGAEVFYLTGRVDRFQRGTVKQLRRLGLPDADNKHVICKPSIQCLVPGKAPAFMPTAPFKVNRLRRMFRDGHHVALFFSDAPSDIAAVQRRTSVSCVKIDFPVGPPGRQPGLTPGTPTIRVK